MSGRLILTRRERPPERLDLGALTPARLAGLSVADVSALAVGTTRMGVCLGDVFAVTGTPGGDIIIEGGDERLDQVGAGLADGSILVVGDVGAAPGRGQRGGRLTIEGSVHGPYAGTGMTGGHLSVGGDAADWVGGALPGAAHGQAGGIILIGGRAGSYAGDRMRRGLLVVLGSTGEATGARMIAGTILAARVGARAGSLMRRGTIVAGSAGPLAPTFLPAGRYGGSFLGLLARQIAILAGPEAAALVPAHATRLAGDMASLGKGEILIPG